MANFEDVKLVVEKVRAEQAQGEECIGMLYNKPVSEWKEIFNEAAKQLGMPVFEVPALKGNSWPAIQEHIFALQQAFVDTDEKPALVLVDTSGNRQVTDENVNFALGKLNEQLTKIFPKAIFLQAVTEGTCAESVCLYSMKPKVPHAPGQPIRPV